MSKNLVIVVLSLALLACLYAVTYRWITADSAQALHSEHPELEWLRREYTLSEPEFAAIRAKHEANDIVCRELCRDLVKAQMNLHSAIVTYPEMGDEVQGALAAWTEQRRRCRESTIRHMYDVCSVMDRDSASRYRERIFRLLILPGKMPHIGKDGEFHEELIEHAAPDSSESTILGK